MPGLRAAEPVDLLREIARRGSVRIGACLDPRLGTRHPLQNLTVTGASEASLPGPGAGQRGLA